MLACDRQSDCLACTYLRGLVLRCLFRAVQAVMLQMLEKWDTMTSYINHTIWGWPTHEACDGKLRCPVPPDASNEPVWRANVRFYLQPVLKAVVCASLKRIAGLLGNRWR